jgi:hypothetical protein
MLTTQKKEATEDDHSSQNDEVKAEAPEGPRGSASKILPPLTFSATTSTVDNSKNNSFALFGACQNKFVDLLSSGNFANPYNQGGKPAASTAFGGTQNYMLQMFKSLANSGGNNSSLFGFPTKMPEKGNNNSTSMEMELDEEMDDDFIKWAF